MRTITLEVPDDTVVVGVTLVRAVDAGKDKKEIRVQCVLIDDKVHHLIIHEEGWVDKNPGTFSEFLDRIIEAEEDEK